MQYQTRCNQCGNTYMVDGVPGSTIHAICPFCGARANVVTPPDGSNARTGEAVRAEGIRPLRHKKSEKPLYLKVTMWFLIIVTVLFLLLTVLYFVFKAMSH